MPFTENTKILKKKYIYIYIYIYMLFFLFHIDLDNYFQNQIDRELLSKISVQPCFRNSPKSRGGGVLLA